MRRGHGWPTHFPALAGPAIAAVIVTAWISGRPGLADLWRRMVRWRFPLRWWAAALGPAVFLAIALAIAAAVGQAPDASAFGRYSGLPALGVVLVALLVVLLNGYGEEVGWRGFALPAIQRRVGARRAALIVAGLWALWHLPFFFLQASYRSFGPPTLVGFLIGIAAGSIVLTWIYNGTGGSILAVVVWHGVYNMAAATAASSGMIAAVVSALVIVQAIVLLRLDHRAERSGGPPLLGPRAPRPCARHAPGPAPGDSVQRGSLAER